MLVLHTNNILVSYITSSKSSFLICQTINSLVDVNHAEEFNSGWRKHHKPWKTSMCSITLYSDRWCLYRKRVDSLPSTIPRGGGGGEGVWVWKVGRVYANLTPTLGSRDVFSYWPSAQGKTFQRWSKQEIVEVKK